MIRRTFFALAGTLAVALTGAASPIAAQTVAGLWRLDVTLDAGNGRATFDLKVDGNVITGTYGGVLGEQTVTGTIEGSRVRFGFESAEAGAIRFDGIVEGDTMEGTCEYGQLGSGSFSGTRAS